MGQPRQRAKHARGPKAWPVAVGVVAAMGLAVLAGYALLSVGLAGRSVKPEPPAHAEIDDASRQQLLQILREDARRDPEQRR